MIDPPLSSKRSAQLVTYPNGAQAPYDPNVALATAQHYAAKVYILKRDCITVFSSVSRLPTGPGCPWRAPPMFTPPPPPRRSPQSSMAAGRGLLMPRPRYNKEYKMCFKKEIESRKC